MVNIPPKAIDLITYAVVAVLVAPMVISILVMLYVVAQDAVSTKTDARIPAQDTGECVSASIDKPGETVLMKCQPR